MKKLLLAVALLWAAPAAAQILPSGPPGVPACNATFQVSQGATALTQIVSAKAGASIYVCGYVFNAGAAAGTAQLEYGTGTNCGTGTTAMTPAFALGVNGVLADRASFGSGLATPPGNALCLVTTGTGPMQVLIYYGQY